MNLWLPNEAFSGGDFMSTGEERGGGEAQKILQPANEN